MMQVQKIDNRTWLITRGEGQASIHNYLLVGDDKAALIDTGFEAEPLKKTISHLTDKPIIVIHTHGHIDHIGNDSQFEEIMLHPADFNLYTLHSSVECRKAFFKERYEELKQNEPDEAENFALKNIKEINRDIQLKPLEGGMRIDLGNRTLKVLETPGHTSGCISIVEKDRKVIYTGDMICEMGVLIHFPESTTIDIYKQSLEMIRSQITAEYRIYSGHQLTPLTIEWIDRYIDCANNLIEFGQTLKPMSTTELNFNQVQFYCKDDLKISYTIRQLQGYLGVENKS